MKRMLMYLMLKFYSLDIVKMQILVIDKLDCNVLSSNSVYNVRINNCSTNDYWIRIDKKRLQEMFSQKSTNNDISLKTVRLRPDRYQADWSSPNGGDERPSRHSFPVPSVRPRWRWEWWEQYANRVCFRPCCWRAGLSSARLRFLGCCFHRRGSADRQGSESTVLVSVFRVAACARYVGTPPPR